MMKIMTGSRKPKGKVLRQLECEKKNNQVFSGMEKSFTVKSTSSGKINNRRRELLNTVFTRHIVDHLATSNLQGLDIQITNVTVSPDISLVKAQWISRSCLTRNNGSLQVELDNYAAVLRKDLSDLRIVGVVPPIKFVPDKTLAQGSIIDQLLETAEMSAEDPVYENEDVVDSMPLMRHDVLGLNREKIVTKILKKNSKHISATLSPLSNESGSNEFASLADINNAIEEFKKMRKKTLREERFRERSLRSIEYEDFLNKEIDVPDFDQSIYEDQDYIDDNDERN
ncbi:Hypothetical predicted protein [Cloeon dipterum]|uniref:Ribosome-binding factor A, mitochondrial n=1 Tax=Cloeon dipterum TaxID=197152 RepID=A0A8S1BVR3_9INSE|nr:Hypothetical predicted protein [Cloeon dipterum]